MVAFEVDRDMLGACFSFFYYTVGYNGTVISLIFFSLTFTSVDFKSAKLPSRCHFIGTVRSHNSVEVSVSDDFLEQSG